MDRYTIHNTILVNTASYSVSGADVLAANTPNTWQPDRTKQETYANTRQGKLAEMICQEILESSTDLSCLPYDDFRADDRKKVAPFDVLLYKSASTTPRQIDDIIHEINQCIRDDTARSGHIPFELKRKINKMGVYLLEIKSSKLNKYERKGTSRIVTRSYSDIEKIVSNLNQHSDFIAYPYFMRTCRSDISFDDYCRIVKNEYPASFDGITGANAIKKRVIQIEIANASNIYTRVYIDYENNRAYVPGYKLFHEFMDSPTIGKMYQKNKSEYAIYFMTPIGGCRPFDTLSDDELLWG